MKIETQTLEDHQVKLKVETDPTQLDEAKRRAARTIAKRAKIPGFRPGKAPYHIVERFAGEEAIYEDALELLMQDLYPKAIEEAGIKPYGPGRLEDIPSKEPLTFEFVVPLEAEVELGDYTALRIPYELEPVTDEQVEKVLENIRQQQAVLEPAERPAQEGDQVQTKIRAERTQPQEGESKLLVREMPAPVVIEPVEPADEEWPFSGFSRKLIGLSAGDEKTITYTYPEDTPFESLRGSEAEFHVVVENVKSRQLPELNDDFAVSQGDYENLEALRNDIRSRLEERARDEYDEEYGEKALNDVIEASSIKFPPQMLEQEMENMMKQLERRLAQQNLDIDTYLKTREMDREALHEELLPSAETRLKKLLVMYEIGKVEDIQVKTEEVQDETIGVLTQIYGSMPEQEANKQISREMISNLTSEVTADLLMKKSMERLRAIAKGEGDLAKDVEPEAQTEADLAEEEARPEVQAGLEPSLEEEVQPEEEAQAHTPESDAAATEGEPLPEAAAPDVTNGEEQE